MDNFEPLCRMASGFLPVLHSIGLLSSTYRMFLRVVGAMGEDKDRSYNLILGNTWDTDRGTWYNPATNATTDLDYFEPPGNTELYCGIYGGNLGTVVRKDPVGSGLCFIRPGRNQFFLDGLCDSDDADYFDTTYYIYGVKNKLPHFRDGKKKEEEGY